MSEIKALLTKTKRRLSEDGIKDTMFLATHYVMRQINNRFRTKEEYKIPSKEAPYFTIKKAPVIYIAAGMPCHDIGGGQRSAQLAKTFNNMGYCVEYLYAFHSGYKKEKDVWPPARKHAYANKENITHVRSTVKKEDIFIFEAPAKQLEPLLDIAVETGCRIIYENIDNWETELGKNFFDETVLKKFLAAANVITGTAKPLVDQIYYYLEKYNIEKEDKKILYLANAVDEKLFCGIDTFSCPADLVQGQQTLLYYGTLNGEWFSWELILGLAKRHPEYEINLIGGTYGLKQLMESVPKNVHFLGPKPQAELPAYLQHVDYALIPFERGEIGDYVSPLKIFEYIAMYARVITTRLPDISGYPNVYYGDTVEEWEAIIASNPAIDQEKAAAFVDENTWFYRITKILQAVDENKPRKILKDRLSIVILNYNNKNVIFRCVNSLLRYQKQYGYQIVVVDNGSTDGSYEQLQEKYTKEQLRLYRNKENGCASGRNLGVSHIDTEYVLFLDSDQWATHESWLRPYEDVMEQYPDFGAVGWTAGFFNPSGIAGLTVNQYPNRYMPPQMLCRTDVGYLGSGGMLLRVEEFRELEGFDTAYDPTCYEDTDLSLKVRDGGGELYYCPYLGVIHLPHQTTQVGSEKYTENATKKKAYFTSKWKQKNPKLLRYVK